MSGNNMWCSKCKSYHHAAEDCVMDKEKESQEIMKSTIGDTKFDIKDVYGLESTIGDTNREASVKEITDVVSDAREKTCHITACTLQEKFIILRRDK